MNVPCPLFELRNLVLICFFKNFVEAPDNNGVCIVQVLDLHPLVNNNNKAAVVTKTLVKSICLGVQHHSLTRRRIDNYVDYTSS